MPNGFRVNVKVMSLMTDLPRAGFARLINFEQKRTPIHYSEFDQNATTNIESAERNLFDAPKKTTALNPYSFITHALRPPHNEFHPNLSRCIGSYVLQWSLSVTEPIFTKLVLPRPTFLENYYTKFHRNPKTFWTLILGHREKNRRTESRMWCPHNAFFSLWRKAQKFV